MDTLIFELAAARYGLPLADVVEIVRAVAITPLPAAPPGIEGIINVRGRIVPVLDVRARFGHPATPVRPDEHLVIGLAGARTVALRAAGTTRLMRIDAADLAAASEVTAGSALVTGMVRLPDGVALLHDLRGFLTQVESASLDAALAGAASASPAAGPG